MFQKCEPEMLWRLIDLLILFYRVGQEALMDDNWADDEIESELAPIAVQLAYVQQVIVV